MTQALPKFPFTTPPGRLVMGSLYKPNTTDAKGNPLVFKRGPDTGKPRVDYFIAVAIQKTRDAAGQVQHWAHSDWGGACWRAGHAYMTHAGQLGDKFHWKIQDGDVPGRNDQGALLPIREGFAGCWILKLSGSFAPKIYNGVGAPDPKNPPPLLEPNAINLGDYVQVFADAQGNSATGDQAGIYVNHQMVCLCGYGPRIITGPDVATAGFGGQGLPQGASMVPVGGAMVPPAAVPGYGPPGAPPMTPPGLPMTPPNVGMPQPGGMPPGYPPVAPQQPQGPGMPPAGYPPAGTVPNQQFLNPPGYPAAGAAPPMPAAVPNAGQPYAPQMPGMPGAMPAVAMGQPPAAVGYPAAPGVQMMPSSYPAPQQPPQQYAQPAVQGYPQAPGQPGMPTPGGYPSATPAPTVRQMTPLARGIPYEAYRAQNWTDAQLVAAGMMLP